MPPVGFETTVPASKRSQTHSLDRADVGIGVAIIIKQNVLILRVLYLTFSACTAKVLLVMHTVACRQQRKLYIYHLRTSTFGATLHYAKVRNSLHNLFYPTENMTKRSNGVTISIAPSSLHSTVFATSRSVIRPRSKY